MSGILWAAIGEVLIGGSLLVDKFLLEDKEERALPYVFWAGMMSAFAALLIPFGFKILPPYALLFCFAAAASFLAVLWLTYSAIALGGATSAAPIIGGFAPVMTYLVSAPILAAPLNIADKIAFIMLTLGGFLLFFSEKLGLKKLLPFVFAASLATGIMGTLQRLAFDRGDFLSVFITIKIFVFALALAGLLFRDLRKKIFERTAAAPKKNKVVYAANRAAAGLGSFFIYYAFSQTPQPALIEALSGLRYVAVFLAALVAAKFVSALAKEKLTGYPLVLKSFATVFIVAALAGISIQKHYEIKPLPDRSEVSWGVTFSEKMSRQFGLQWRENYSAILSDLKPEYVRLIAYWDEIEPEQGKYDFNDMDWQMNEAAKAGVKVVLAIGQRVPRWPECHFPSWVDPNGAEKNDQLLGYLEKIVERYRGAGNLLYWQVENEPFFLFGECPRSDAALLEREIAAVRKLDPARKIFMTDGGEFGDWIRTAERADVFGPTLYRKVHSNIFGYITWPLTPELYPLHRDITRKLTGKPQQEFVISELGLEPWMEKQTYETDIRTQLEFFTPDDFRKNISFARRTGFDVFYAWGAEWWYYLRVQGYPVFWDMARELFSEKRGAS
jgi:hypothetical protein